MNFLRGLLIEDGGATAVEYAVMLAAILLSAIVAIAALGSQSGGMWGGIEGSLNDHGFGQ